MNRCIVCRRPSKRKLCGEGRCSKVFLKDLTFAWKRGWWKKYQRDPRRGF